MISNTLRRVLLVPVAAATLLGACASQDNLPVEGALAPSTTPDAPGEELAPVAATPPATSATATTEEPAGETLTFGGVELQADDADEVVLQLGDRGPAVLELQKLLLADGENVNRNGVFAAATVIAVRNSQRRYDLPITGDVSIAFIRTVQTGVSAKPTTTAGENTTTTTEAGTTPGSISIRSCVVALVGDSLVAGSSGIYEDALTDATGCTARVDGLGSRTLYDGYLCSETVNGVTSLDLRRADDGSGNCDPSGITVLRDWKDLTNPGDVTVVALGTNDSVTFDSAERREHLDTAYEILTRNGIAPRMVLVTVAARPGSDRVAAAQRTNTEMRSWCAAHVGCRIADWANAPAALLASSYTDAVHLTPAAVRARAALIADVAGSLI